MEKFEKGEKLIIVGESILSPLLFSFRITERQIVYFMRDCGDYAIVSVKGVPQIFKLKKEQLMRPHDYQIKILSDKANDLQETIKQIKSKSQGIQTDQKKYGKNDCNDLSHLSDLLGDHLIKFAEWFNRIECSRHLEKPGTYWVEKYGQHKTMQELIDMFWEENKSKDEQKLNEFPKTEQSPITTFTNALKELIQNKFTQKGIFSRWASGEPYEEIFFTFKEKEFKVTVEDSSSVFSKSNAANDKKANDSNKHVIVNPREEITFSQIRNRIKSLILDNFANGQVYGRSKLNENGDITSEDVEFMCDGKEFSVTIKQKGLSEMFFQ